MIIRNRIKASPIHRSVSPTFCLGAFIFAVLVSSIQAYPMSQQGLKPVPTADTKPLSDKATQSIRSVSFTVTDHFVAQAPPTISVGAFLGSGGLETPEFKKKCQQCCRKTIKALGNTLPVLRSCGKCKINRNVQASGACDGETLGFSNSASRCFAERCSAMLTAAQPGCFCLES